ncbi:MAG TPA: hypothetical protein VGI75_15730 [Pirellulales bacterium]
MNHSENEILISAYLDGELTADEKSRVEQLLTTDADARQLLDELRAIRARLQALPQHRLAPDFTQQVLDRTQVGESLRDSHRVPERRDYVPTPTPDSRPATARRIPIFASRRSIIWSLATIAAAVVIAVTTRQNAPQRELVPNGARQPAVAAQNAEPNSTLELTGRLVTNRNETAKESIDAAPAARGLAPSAAPPVTAEPLIAGNSPPQTVQTPADGFRAFAAQPQQASQPPHPNIGAIADSKLKSAEAQSAAGAITGLDQIQKSATAATEYGIVEESLIRQVAAGNDDVLVVHIAVSPEAARRGAFEQLLAGNRITLARDESDSAASTAKPKNEIAGGGQNADRYVTDQPTIDRKDISDDSTAKRTEDFAFKVADPTKDTKSRASTTSASDVEAIFVEASPGQIARTLTALRNNATEFPLIAGTITRGLQSHDGAIGGLQLEQIEQRTLSGQSQAIPIQLPGEKQASSTPQAAPSLTAQNTPATLNGKRSAASGLAADGFGGGRTGGDLTLGGLNSEAEGRARRLAVPLSGKNIETLGITSSKAQADFKSARDKSDPSLNDTDGVKSGDSNQKMQFDSSQLGSGTPVASETNKKLAIDRRRSAGESGAIADDLAAAQPRRALFLLRIVDSPIANPPQTNGSDTGRPSTSATMPPAKSD